MNNSGALEVAREIGTALDAQQLEVTSDAGEVGACERMLIYMNGLTWTSGEASAAFASDVEAAMAAGVELLPAHETLGEGTSQEARHGVEFETIIDATPHHLLARGMYHRIAISLKSGAWRKVSMAMLLQELSTRIEADPAATNARGPTSAAVEPRRSTRVRSRFASLRQLMMPRRPLETELPSSRTHIACKEAQIATVESPLALSQLPSNFMLFQRQGSGRTVQRQRSDSAFSIGSENRSSRRYEEFVEDDAVELVEGLQHGRET